MTAEFFINNRQKLQELFSGKAPIFIAANGLVQSSADLTYKFRQDRNFWYLCGLDIPGSVLYLDAKHQILILPDNYLIHQQFDGGLSHEQISRISGIDHVIEAETAWKLLGPKIKKLKHVASLAPWPSYLLSQAFYTNPARRVLIKKLKSLNPNLEILDLKQHLSKMRMVKQDFELKSIESAINITETVILNLLRTSWAKDTKEYQLAAFIDYQFSMSGADGSAFESIVAFGANSATIHHQPGQNRLRGANFCLIDIGADYQHYASDISRPLLIKPPTKRWSAVYQTIKELNQFALSLIRPGITHLAIEEQVQQMIGEKLRALGLIKTIDKASIRQYAPTYAMHHLGLDPHDAADPTVPLKVGMVLAVEPGIYISEEGIGLRIENDVVVTDHGFRKLNSLPDDLTYLKIKSD